MTVRSISIAEVVDRQVLAGRAQGLRDFPRIEAAVGDATEHDDRVVLSFIGMEVITSSYFQAAVWPLWSRQPEVFPTLADLSRATLDDIELVLRAHSAAIWVKQDREPTLHGVLDPQLMATLEGVLRIPSASASDLLEVDRSIGATAWSNRLAALHQLRLVRRRKNGRRLVYAAPWKEF